MLYINTSSPNAIYYWMMRVLLFGLGLFFIVLTLCYVFTYYQSDAMHLIIPIHFYLNLLPLLVCSYAIQKSWIAYQIPNIASTQSYLWVASIAGLLFMVIQILGFWYLYHTLRLAPNSSTAIAYLYVIAGLHLLHIIAGSIAMAIMQRRIHIMCNNEVVYLEEITKPNRGDSLKALLLYWHFVDAVWLYLILFFSIFK